MNTEESPVSRGLTNEPPPKPRLHPVKVFVVLVALVALSLIAALIVRQGQATVTEPIEQPDYSLTDAEAIARFNELKDLRDEAYKSRDPKMIDLIYTSEALLRARVDREIRTLARKDVLDRTRFITENIKVVSNTPQSIRLIQSVDVFPKFITESGKDITASGRPEHRRVRWTLHREGDQWLVYDVLIVAAEPIKDSQ